MQLIKKFDVYVCVSSYDERDIPKSAGCRWDPDQRYWWTDRIEVAKRLYKYADKATQAAIDAYENEKAAAITASRAVDSVRELPCPRGLEYRGFQKAGIEWALDHPQCLIADEMGLGKTIQAIGVINALPELTKILVVVPASLKLNWKRECEKWLIRKLSVEIVNGDWTDADILIINYDIVRKYAEKLKAVTWDLLICDEAHYLKNPKAQRTQMVLGYEDVAPIRAHRKIFLTGTPVLNRPIELYPLLRATGCGYARSWYDYVTRYCAGQRTRYGWDVSGASNTDELNAKLRSSIMIRREKSQVLTELPEKIHQLLAISPNGNQKYVDREQKAWQAYEEKTARQKKHLKELSAAGKIDSDEYKKAVTELRDSARADFAEISKLRHETALAKVPAVVENILSAAENGNSVVVFGHHTDVLDGIVAELRKNGTTAEKFDGETSLKDRDRIVADFQAGKIQVFVGGMKAAGLGLTLTRSSCIIFAELDWTPATISQAEDRCHRIGQANSVLIQHIVFDGSIDCMLAKKLIEKKEILEAILQ